MPEQYLYSSSGDFLRTYGPVQQTLKAARVAMWSMHWQMRGLMSVNPSLPTHKVSEHFALGSDVTGIDLYEFFARRPWEELEAQITRLLLMDVIAMYEGWSESLA